MQQLLLPDQRSWNEDLVRIFFWEHEARTILAVPPSLIGSSNKILWGLSSDGNFSARSALTLKSAGEGEASEPLATTDFWKRIWSLNIPKKAKNFMWCLYIASIPTNSNLIKKNAIENANCPICFNEEEIAIHIVQNCKAENDVWLDKSLAIKKWQK